MVLRLKFKLIIEFELSKKLLGGIPITKKLGLIKRTSKIEISPYKLIFLCCLSFLIFSQLASPTVASFNDTEQINIHISSSNVAVDEKKKKAAEKEKKTVEKEKKAAEKEKKTVEKEKKAAEKEKKTAEKERASQN